MSLSCRARRIANSLPSGIQSTDGENVVDPFFKKLQTLLRCEGKSPAYERQVYAVFAVILKLGAIEGIEVGIRHNGRIALFV